MYLTAATVVGCCRAPMPTAATAAVRMRGHIPQLWPYAQNFKTNATDIPEVGRKLLKRGWGHRGLEIEGREIEFEFGSTSLSNIIIVPI